MSNRFDLLTQQLFQKNINDCSIGELQNLARQYPYFAPAQYALVKKLEQTNSAEYTDQLQKTILYYHNPIAFDQFINEESYALALEPIEEVLPEYSEPELNQDEVIAHAEPVKEEEIEVEAKENQALKDEPIITIENFNTLEPEPITPVVTESPIEENVTETAPKLIAEPDKDQGTGLAFEPFHTVDYFASQGIKLSQEEATKDRFGKQLKSFTDWLKTMKKLPVSEQAKSMDTVSEKKVENLAAHSVEQAEVVTETMAEVWVKQGNMEKAMEIYNKLGLIYPDKRTYFAAKIDSLK